jgi:putative sigma-54 modulation protein
MEPAESLRSYAEDKVSKINKYLDFPMEAHVVLKVEKFRHVADVTLSVNGAMIKGAEETGDMYSAIDQVMDKIEKQVKKYRQKGRFRRVESIKGEDTPERGNTVMLSDLVWDFINREAKELAKTHPNVKVLLT